MTTVLPPPDCTYGHSAAQLRALLGSRYPAFPDWTIGTTVTICSDVPPCAGQHGAVFMVRDVLAFVRAEAPT